MRTLTAVSLSIASAACVSFAIASGFDPEPRPLGAADDPSVERLAERLARLEQALRSEPLSAPMTSAGEPVDATLPRTRIDAGAADTVVAELAVRLDDVERRLEALSHDPLTRAFGSLASASPEARREAIELLERFAPFDPSARESIRSLLEDLDAGVRREALEAVGRLGDLEALPKVSALLADDDAGVRREAADSLEDLLSDLKKGSPEYRAGIEALIARMADGDAEVREEIVDSIGDLGPELATQALVGLLGDPEPDVREEAISALGRSGDPSALPHLRQLYQAGPSPNRLDVAIAMSRLGDPSAFRREAVALVANAQNMSISDRERARAIWILGNVDPAAYRDVFTWALDDPSSRVRYEAERALRGSR